MAACRSFPEHACTISRSGYQRKAGKRRRRNRRALHHARERALSIAFQVISGGYGFDQQEGREGALVHRRKTRSKTCLTVFCRKCRLDSTRLAGEPVTAGPESARTFRSFPSLLMLAHKPPRLRCGPFWRLQDRWD